MDVVDQQGFLLRQVRHAENIAAILEESLADAR